MTETTKFRGLVPYLFYDDVEPMLEWYSRVFGWLERGRWLKDGKVENAEMQVGDTELWLDGGGVATLEHAGTIHPVWIGVWVDDVEVMYEQVRAAGVEVQPPMDKSYNVRMLTVEDPAGYEWGFMTRIAP
jgi:uncharacterized glyoxalase superfamily protein PhnB